MLYQVCYLSGAGFYARRLGRKLLQTICRNRRVFKGNNLIVKGAAYASKRMFPCHLLLINIIISCKGRTRVKITMAVRTQR
ncbi:MAG: DUF5716 family protein [Eubacterium sp.]